MEDVKEKQIKETLENLDAKNFGIYYFILDTKGNPSAAIATIYEHVKVLNNLGYKAYILHEKNDYRIRANENGAGVADWLGEEYANLPHISLESQQLNVGAKDFIVIPEVFSNVMEQCKNFPSKRIVLCQSYEYIFELLPLGITWVDYGINDVITTSQKQADYVKQLFPNMNVHIIPVSIPEYFKPTDKMQKPIVSLFTRNQNDAHKIVKSFYAQYPIYRWVTFRELRSINNTSFAEAVAESCLAVWVDDIAGFGTFPIEAIESNTPVIGKIPNMIPEWMATKNEDGTLTLNENGVWTNDLLAIPELIATFLKLYLEDSIPENIINGMEASKGQYTRAKQEVKIQEVYSTLVEARKNEISEKLKLEKTN
jgi:hypothetical protein